MTRTKISENPKPLLGHLPPPPDAKTRLLLTECLQGHTTSESWLPAGLSPELDELRAEQLRLRGQAVAILEGRAGLLARLEREDKHHLRALEQAARDGSRGPEDRRTPPDQRDRELTALDERLCSTLRVMGEVAAAVIELVRAHEDEWLGDLRQRLEPARQKREEAQRLLAEAESEAWQLHQTGHWLQQLADDGAMSRQPAPGLVPPPAQFSRHLLEESLTRPWQRRRPWNGADVVAPPPTSDIVGRRPRKVPA